MVRAVHVCRTTVIDLNLALSWRRADDLIVRKVLSPAVFRHSVRVDVPPNSFVVVIDFVEGWTGLIDHPNRIPMATVANDTVFSN